ncbi:aspartyl-tRNA(Asn) amidotransferase subunit A [Rhodococcus aetherivorans]|uniref:Aspartyl-tRNA(Asn) amidotransferase subunit A n=1 Tax=Rhodococcus aetherivorans TaxID=191292 RepID=A0ABQ0YQH5_9NOCA|nr:Amidase [Rhodococcus rhodochrous ATCC 21198]GES38714.1 aspartyl-tRNA(Asn) amidotransferase subunit A [Rhodococcus aetherivorans]
MTLRDTTAALAKGELTATGHVRQVLADLDALDGTPWSNLVAARNDAAALESAARADAELAAGNWIGPLHGVAVAVKDNIDVAGMPTRCGSNVLADAPPAARDARIVERLREAGAVVVAKTHLHEFAYGPSGLVNASGPARHPHDPTRITGGSSSGSAALVAKGIVPLALGTDTGCSVRTPAALCGVVGLKPTRGALPVDGVFPLSTTFDHVGLLARDVLDAGLAWGALPGIAHLRTPVSGLRVGRLRGGLWDVPDAAFESALDDACRTLAHLGAEVRDVTLPETDDLLAVYPVVTGSEAYETHQRWFENDPDLYQPATAALLAAQRDRPATDYVRAVRTAARLRRDVLRRLRRDDGLDALITVTTPLRSAALDSDPAALRGPLLQMCIPFSVLGVPAVSVPAPGGGDFPIGVQVIGLTTGTGGHGSHPAESTALALAMAVEGSALS